MDSSDIDSGLYSSQSGQLQHWIVSKSVIFFSNKRDNFLSSFTHPNLYDFCFMKVLKISSGVLENITNAVSQIVTEQID